MTKDNQKPHARSVFRGLAAVASGLGATGPAFAGIQGGTITFSSVSASAIPTLGSAALVLLSLLMAVLAFKSYRKSHSLTPAVAGLLGLAALASTGGGIHLVQEARATFPANDVEVSEPGAKTFPVGTNNFENTSGSPLQVDDLEIEELCTLDENTTDNPECAIGTVIEDTEICAVVVICPT